MKFRTLVIGYSLALALFLFAQHRPGAPQAGAFHSVVDLTRSLDLVTSSYHAAGQTSRSMFLPVSAVQPVSKRRSTTFQMQMATRIIAPAAVAPGLWNVDQIPAGRLVAPLVVLDISAQTPNLSDNQVSVEDIARWEHANGEIPLGAVVIARTGSSYNKPEGQICSRILRGRSAVPGRRTQDSRLGKRRTVVWRRLQPRESIRPLAQCLLSRKCRRSRPSTGSRRHDCRSAHES